MDKTVSLGNNGGADSFVAPDSGSDVPEAFLRKGHLLKNRYEVLSVIGHGGFGITYACRDVTLNLKVAVKEYYPDGFVTRDCKKSATVTYSTTPENMEFIEKGRKRFIDEARVLAKFAGEAGIVDVRDYFEENNTAYIVMEFLDGKDLRQYLKEKGRLPAEHAVKLLLPVMESLEKVHRQGLIHRDISPDNIRMVGKKVKLLDFGAARDFSFEGNKTMTVMLKRGYAPIEQYGAVESQGPWTDVYALCATLYLCITGRKPADALVRWENDPLQKPSQLGVTISSALENVIMKGLSVSAKDRYQSMNALVYGLKLALTGNSVLVDQRNINRDSSRTQRANNGNINRDNANIKQDNASSSFAANDEAAKSENEKPKKKSKILIPIIAIVLVIAILAGVLVLRHFGYFTPAYGGDVEMVVDEETPSDGAEVVGNEGTDSEENTTETELNEQLTEENTTVQNGKGDIVNIGQNEKNCLEDILEHMIYFGGNSFGNPQENIFFSQNVLYDSSKGDSSFKFAFNNMLWPPYYTLFTELEEIYNWIGYQWSVGCECSYDTNNEFYPDPRGLFEYYEYVDIEYADFVLENVYNVKPDHSYTMKDDTGRVIAYYDDSTLYYEYWDGGDGAGPKVDVDPEARKLSDEKYLITAHYCESDTSSEWNHMNIEVVASRKTINIEFYGDYEIWSIYEIRIVE